ncbi:hypothetical protein HHL11_11940 [Ramlibacter sp. G-1-2-2]|uniref:Periplasmic heavy metal sensor n=1 Tax=Ramlibacter agri TaxID=2728837 RepID=A0A848H0H6_9BURK|nr:hypothetical protein [Ramlibacter agri]NML44466.1 hypothetical protein [Ramlibacter agri]
MQSTATFFESQSRPSRDGMLRWIRAAAWVVLAGAVSLGALAQAPADATAGEKTEAPSEPQGAAGPGAMSHAEEASGPWNKRPKAPTGVDGQLKRLAIDLKLDAAQQAKIKPILVARSEQMQRLQQDTQLTPTERRQRALAIGDRSSEQIRAQLTDAQRAQYIQPRAATVAQAGPPGKRSGMPPATATPGKGVTP